MRRTSVSRRGFLAAGGGIAALTVLGACGNSGDSGSGGNAPTSAAPPAEREVQTDKGAVKVPGKAQKVACADFFGAFVVADLGLVPVGASGGGYDKSGPLYAPKLGKVPVVGDFTKPDPEKIAGTDPDLILRTIDTDDALYKQLTGIAPTVVVSFQKLSLTEVTTRIGDILGRKEEAGKLLAEYNKRTQEIKTKHAAVLGKYTFTYAQSATDTTFWTLGEKWTDTKVLVDCGARLAEPSKSQTDPTKEYSMEQIGILGQSDVLLVPSTIDGTAEAPENAPLTSNALWKQLPAVKAGRVFPVLSGAASLGTGLELVTVFDKVLTKLAG
ncbi:ABC transporter substrate-binding protein [Kibdelosporangium phytohabitans]|uniref:ABC transporter substrate-binding protein n=1 Tax=Kibdelosporangium phytohabitans TaxID=860235 RepID=UPI001470514E|nr:ABC transporter substrate-binding protein [Kibdelosporangium phytohabitans]MBE1470315.1 iron complex transport system substrate-binding protein [Kibdelosporangium phytohabitans]